LSDMAPTEIVALGRIIDELDYYQLLHLDGGATPVQVKQAYYSSSRVFHPDGHRRAGPELRSAVERISKRITEAYSVLRDPRRRQAYDHKLGSGEGRRMPLAEAKTAATRSTQQRSGKTAQGRQFYRLAQVALEKNDLEGASRNLQTALTFESDNQGFKDELAELRRRLIHGPR
jgi:curved DNA-binding protein CbpA